MVFISRRSIGGCLPSSPGPFISTCIWIFQSPITVDTNPVTHFHNDYLNQQGTAAVFICKYYSHYHANQKAAQPTINLIQINTRHTL